MNMKLPFGSKKIWLSVPFLRACEIKLRTNLDSVSIWYWSERYFFIWGRETPRLSSLFSRIHSLYKMIISKVKEWHKAGDYKEVEMSVIRD